MPTITDRLSRLGLSLPEPPKPVASYVPAAIVSSGCPVFVSGQLPFKDGSLIATGTVPDVVTPEMARKCAQQCVLNGLAALQSEIGSLERLRRVIRLGVFVASGPGFFDQPSIANGASDLLVELLGEQGKHARAAVSVPSLPLNAPVEIEFLFNVD